MAAVRNLLMLSCLALLSACATGFSADVKRFQALPAAVGGETFVVQASDAEKADSLEFASYAGLVRDRLVAQGYVAAAAGAAPTLIVTLDYAVDKGREKVESRPGFGGAYPAYGFGGYPFYYRFNGQIVRPGGYGWYDPFGPAWGVGDITSYTVYDSFLDLRITRAGSNERLFEGRAEARTLSNDLTKLVPNLTAAMFTGFPGQTAVRERVRVPPPVKSN